VYKPRSSPLSFQGLGEEGIDYLTEAAKSVGLLTITEAVDEYSLKLINERIDMIQIGARNMQNYQLLKLAGKLNKPILLKRGLSATIDEWLLASQYILNGGNSKVILCERGIRTFEPSTRNTLDLSAVILAKLHSQLPVIVDPSHASGRRDLVPALSKASIAVGADGLIIEMHPSPNDAKSDGDQSLTPGQFISMAYDFESIAKSVGRKFTIPANKRNVISN
jgi:3-deoxy-7-phosphoheptulonate synthase